MPPHATAELVPFDRALDVFGWKRPIVADHIERDVRMVNGECSHGANQIGHPAAIEDRAHVENSWVRRAARRSTRRVDALRYHANLLIRHTEVFEDLALGELGDGDDRRRAERRRPRERSPPDALAEAKPFGVRHEREIVNRDDCWNREPQRRFIRRREPDVEPIGGGRARHRDLLPPRAAGAIDHARREAARVARELDGRVRVEHELVRLRAGRGGPLAEQAAEVAADAGRAARELARVDADADRHLFKSFRVSILL